MGVFQKTQKFWQKSKLKYSKMPSLKQWKSFFQVVSKKEKFLFLLFLFLFLASGSYLIFNFYSKNTALQPAEGGVYKEGVVGKARIINPLYALSDAERDLVEILFRGLMKYNSRGEIVPDLAEKYEIQEEGKIYEISLKDNLFWSDGKPLTTEDIIFTVKVLQNPATKSPYLASWLDVGVEKIDEKTLKFYLKNPYFPFLELMTFKIIPKHIWQEVPLENFPLALYNLKPISSGPYQVEKIEQDDLGYITSVTLSKNPYYYNEGPFLSKIILLFFKKEEELLASIFNQKVKGFSLTSPEQKFSLHFKSYQVLLPRYFALFFNLESEILAEKNVRKALSYATDKKEILEKVLQNQGKIVHSPFLADIYNFNPPSQIYERDIEKAKELLITAGFTRINEKGIREKILKKKVEFEFKSNLSLGSQGREVEELQKCLAKDKAVYPEGKITGFFGKLTKEAVIRFQEKYATTILEPQGLKKGTGKVRTATRKKLNELCAVISEEVLPLKLNLVTVEQTQLKKVADLLKKQWQELGIDLKIKTLPLSELEQNYLRPRNYEILLFGQVLGIIPDLFPFWHSKQTKDPGLNLANYKNKAVDELLVKARQAQDFQTLRENYEKLQDILIEEVPALFLYSPYYHYFLSPNIKGFKNTIIADPSKRFSNIANWYINTKRVWISK